MAQSKSLDPVAAWQQLVGQWERQINDAAAGVSGTDEFAGTMNQAAKLSFAARKALDETMERMAQSMQLATHAQMISVIERLDRIEEHLQTIAAALAPADRQAAAREPKRTRRPTPDGGA